jgi:NAD(P)-dependent dehydrogenase (short-subunit alcohol dehydrogenase family)
MLSTISSGGTAIVIGANGGIGGALAERLADSDRFVATLGLSRSSTPPIDLGDEASIAAAATHAREMGPVRLLVIATGFLHDERFSPEKSRRDLDPAHMAHAFAVNTIGPAMVLKHFLPLLPRSGKSVVAAISAKVGSIGDNRLGGWYSYRAAKAALNQIIRTAAVELGRSHPEAVCIAMHPGTVDTALSRPFSKAGLAVQSPDKAASAILTSLNALAPEASGGFFDRSGTPLPW